MRYIIILISLFIFWTCTKKAPEKTPLEKRFNIKTQSYAFVVPNLNPVNGVGGISAQNCRACHTQIYDEWKQSTHSKALADIQFQAELSKHDSPKWICLNCHIPIQNQREEIITHLKNNDIFKPISKKNPSFNKELQKEAITCAACHIRQDSIGNSYIIGSFGTKSAPHPVKKDPEFLQNICNRCHDPKGEGLTKNLICWFDSFKELSNSQKDVKKEFKKNMTCINCHMPSEKRRAVPHMTNLPIREGHQHHWVGSGLPKWFKDYDHLIKRGYHSALQVKLDPLKNIIPGKNLNISLHLTNKNAGHWLPTADPERFILVIAELKDASGQSLVKTKYRIGQTWKWDPAKKIADNRLKQGETRKWSPQILIPASIDNHILSITALHVRVTSENAKHMSQAKGVNENYLENGQKIVLEAIHHYPLANFIYKQEINLSTRTRKIYNDKELIELSKQEKGKPLSQREY